MTITTSLTTWMSVSARTTLRKEAAANPPHTSNNPNPHTHTSHPPPTITTITIHILTSANPIPKVDTANQHLRTTTSKKRIGTKKIRCRVVRMSRGMKTQIIVQNTINLLNGTILTLIPMLMLMLIWLTRK